MQSLSTPYDELPYRSFPIEWTAPERLALTSLLHGGPRQRLEGYRVLELGCGDGTNLIPMAYYRQHATFVGVDGAHSQIAIANEKRATLGLTNVSFVASDLQSAAATLSGQFDFIVAHGVFSWISCDARDALLVLCAGRLRPGGLLYLNYNAKPGWNVRGLIRDFLMVQTSNIVELRGRAERAREIAARMAEELNGATHPYSQLLANEFRFVGETPLSHTAHEYLADHNHAYTRKAFVDLLRDYNFAYVADADYNYVSGRLPEGLLPQIARLNIDSETLNETVDLLCYRQLHSPIVTQHSVERRPPSVDELSTLTVVSPIVERGAGGDGVVSVFEHPSGYQVEAKSESMACALRTLHGFWPRGRRLGELFSDIRSVIDDVELLHRNGMIELRLIESRNGNPPEPLNRLERNWGGPVTTEYHTVHAHAAPSRR